MPEAPYRVVIADDVGEHRLMLRLVLEQSGHFEVAGEAGDGHEAVAAVTEHQPDLLLLDLTMPRMDGMEALPLVLEAAPATVVCVLTGWQDAARHALALAHGAHHVIGKGLSTERLVSELLALVQSRVTAPLR